MELHHLMWFSLGAMSAVLPNPWYIGRRAWHAVGRRRDQRRTEARLAEWKQAHSGYGSSGRLCPHLRLAWETCPHCEREWRSLTNGVTERRPRSSRATGTTTDGQSGRRIS
jgi:hypothetical protein